MPETRNQFKRKVINKSHRQRIAYIVAIGIPLVVLCTGFIVCGYLYWEWTGFGSSTNYKGEKIPAKTLWDWMQLFIIPFVLAVGGYFFRITETNVEHELAERRAQESALDDYLNQISELLRHKEFHASSPNSIASHLARTRTITVVRRLDGRHNEIIFQFLQEGLFLAPTTNVEPELVTHLRQKPKLIVDLNGADLRGANLYGANLKNIRISGADLSKADLSDADLSDADLSITNLRMTKMVKAKLSNAFLHRANLSFSNLDKADLSGALLFMADLTGANLSGANLSYANLTGAFLDKADLRGANLIHATFSDDEQLAKVRSLKGTTLPNGSKHCIPWFAQILASFHNVIRSQHERDSDHYQ
jgi:hypothetical protein